MFKAIKEFFMGNPVDVVAPGSAPYKVPEPTATIAEAAPIVVEVIVSETIVAPVVVETPAKAPRKPRAPKAAPVAKEKAPAKAKAPKVTKLKKV